ncbi:MAG: hypothetical protein ACK53K_07785 [Burkholderiales bacterium]
MNWLTSFLILMVFLPSFVGCDMLGIDSPEKIAAAKDAEGRAIGGACRHAARAIEDCYALNRRADKAAVFAGWRDMNDYMRENNLEPVVPVIKAPVKADSSQSSAPETSVSKKDKDEHRDKAKPAPEVAPQMGSKEKGS